MYKNHHISFPIHPHPHIPFIPQSKTKFITSIVDRVYECENNIGKIGK